MGKIKSMEDTLDLHAAATNGAVAALDIGSSTSSSNEELVIAPAIAAVDAEVTTRQPKPIAISGRAASLGTATEAQDLRFVARQASLDPNVTTAGGRSPTAAPANTITAADGSVIRLSSAMLASRIARQRSFKRTRSMQANRQDNSSNADEDTNVDGSSGKASHGDGSKSVADKL